MEEGHLVTFESRHKVLPHNDHCPACEAKLPLLLGSKERCQQCQWLAHSRCTFTLSSTPEQQPSNEPFHVSPKRLTYCLKCCVAILRERYEGMQRKRGKVFHTYGQDMSMTMGAMLRSISVFFNYLGIAEGKSVEDFRRDREQAVFDFYQKAPSFLIGGKPPQVGKLLQGEIGPGQGVCVYLPLSGEDVLVSERDGCTLVVLAFHGGAFVMGTHTTPAIDTLLRVVCQRARVICVSANYRKAPENRFPAWLDDAEAAFRWTRDALPAFLESHGSNILRDRGFRVVIMGDSAGGNLSVGVAHRLALKNDPQYLVSAIMALYPVLNLQTADTRSWVELGDGKFLLRRSLMPLLREFFSDEDVRSGACSPMLEENVDVLKRLPVTHILVGKWDPLRDESYEYLRLRNQHAPHSATLTLYTTCPHGWISFPVNVVEKEESMLEIVAVLQEWGARILEDSVPQQALEEIEL